MFSNIYFVIVEIAATNEQYKDLSQKLDDCNKNLIKETARIVELESKCTTLNDDKTKLDSEKKKLEEEIACLLKQSGKIFLSNLSLDYS